MAKFPEAQLRLFKNIFICKRCKSKIRTQSLKVLEKKVTCRKCKYHELRPLRKK